MKMTMMPYYSPGFEPGSFDNAKEPQLYISLWTFLSMNFWRICPELISMPSFTSSVSVKDSFKNVPDSWESCNLKK